MISNPIQILREEHDILLQAIEVAEKVQKIKSNERYYELMHDLILFLRNYTEMYHYPKEEEVLYPLLRNRTGEMSDGFIHEICDNHEDFKALMADMENYYCDEKYSMLRSTTDIYLRELTEHILRENNIVLNQSGQLLDTREQKTICEEFQVIDEKFAEGYKQELKESLYHLKACLE